LPPYPDNTLPTPPSGNRPDNPLPGEGLRPDNTLPPYPDIGLPPVPVYPDNTLPTPPVDPGFGQPKPPVDPGYGIPEGGRPTHPIVYPPGLKPPYVDNELPPTPGLPPLVPTHPIVLPPEGLPPGSTLLIPLPDDLRASPQTRRRGNDASACDATRQAAASECGCRRSLSRRVAVGAIPSK
jgi:hypothetical protein